MTDPGETEVRAKKRTTRVCGNGTETDTEIDYSGRYSMGGDLGNSPVLKFSRADSRGRWTHQNTSIPESDTDEGKPLNQKRSKVESGISQEATSRAQDILESPVGGEPLEQKEQSFASIPFETPQSPVQHPRPLRCDCTFRCPVCSFARPWFARLLALWTRCL